MTIEHIYISPEHIYAGHHGRAPGETPMMEVDEIECVAGRGLRGDRYFDYKPSYKGQATFFSQEVFARLCDKLTVRDRDFSALRRNIIVKDVDLNSLIGCLFEVQGVCFEGTEECRPCYWMERAIKPGAEAALRGSGGLRVKILSDGVLKKGPAALKSLDWESVL